jgi:hypothetical protein
MGCVQVNLTAEEVMNARKNGSQFMQPSLNQTQAETMAKGDLLNASVKKVNEKYFVLDVPIKSRVSEYTKRKKGLGEQSINADNDIKRDGGTFIHDIMKDLLEFHIHGKGKIVDIKAKALAGNVKLNPNHFIELNKLAERTFKDIKRQQDLIDPKGKVEIRTEYFVADFLKDVGGTMDVFAVFSDNTGLIYDFKTSGRNDPLGRGEHGIIAIYLWLSINE